MATTQQQLTTTDKVQLRTSNTAGVSVIAGDMQVRGADELQVLSSVALTSAASVQFITGGTARLNSRGATQWSWGVAITVAANGQLSVVGSGNQPTTAVSAQVGSDGVCSAAIDLSASQSLSVSTPMGTQL
jgi:hypothetical protein